MSMNSGFERMWNIITLMDEPFWTVDVDSGNGILAPSVGGRGLRGVSRETMRSSHTGVMVTHYDCEHTVDTLAGPRTVTASDYYEVYAFTPPDMDGCGGGDDVLFWSGFGERNAFLAFYNAHLSIVLECADQDYQDHLTDSCDYSF